MIKYGINTDDRYFGHNVIIRLDELKTELIENILEGLKRLPDSKASFKLIEEWEVRKNV